MRNLYSRNPERVLELQQINDIKYKKGCRACCKRDLRAMAIDGVACSVPGNYPRPVFCSQWQFDEGLENVNNSKAA